MTTTTPVPPSPAQTAAALAEIANHARAFVYWATHNDFTDPECMLVCAEWVNLLGALEAVPPPSPASDAAADLAAAVVAFGERLPGWWWRISNYGDGSAIADCGDDKGGPAFSSGACDTPAAALRAVMAQALDAVQARGEGG